MELHNQDEKVRELEVEGASKLWVGKDYVNFIYKDFIQLDMPYHGNFEALTTPCTLNFSMCQKFPVLSLL